MVCMLRPFVHCVGWNLKLLQCWGGGLLSHLLLGLPPPMLYSFGPAINYITVHLFVTLFFKHFPDVCIASPIMISVTDLNILAAISTNPRHSSFPHGCPYSYKCRYIFFESSLRSKRPPRICIFTSHPYVGGGHRVSRGRFLGKHSWYLECRLGIEYPSSASRWCRLAWHSRFMGWCFGWLVFALHLGIHTVKLMPQFLKAFIYSATTGHPAFSSFSTFVSLVFSSSILPSPRKPHADSDFPPLHTLGAKSIATAVLCIFFAARVLHTHWLKPGISPPKVVGVSNAGKKPKKKTQ